LGGRSSAIGEAPGLCAKISFELRFLGSIVFGVRWIAKFNLLGNLPGADGTSLLSAALRCSNSKTAFIAETRTRFWRHYWSFWVALPKVADEPQTVPD